MKPSPHQRLVSNIEKLAKVSVVRTLNGSTNSVLTDLKWIEDNYIKILELHDSNYLKFKDLFDPNGRFQIRQFENLDFNLADFINSTVVYEENTVSENRRFKKKYQEIYDKDSHEELTLRYSIALLDIWNAAEEKKNLILQQNILYTFANWIYILDSLKSQWTNFTGVLKSILYELKLANADMLKNKEAIHPLSSFLSYRIALNRIFESGFELSNSGIYFDYILENIFYAIIHHKPQVAKNFISSIIDSNYLPNAFGGYSKFYELANEQLRVANYQSEERVRALNQIARQYEKAFYLRSKEELKEWEVEFDGMIASKIGALVDLSDASIGEITKIKTYAENNLKYNILQQLVVKVGAIAIFRRETSILEFAMEYNQPGDSRAIQGNDDILPKTLPDILNYLSVDHLIEHDLYHYWEGHHGVEIYLQQVFLLLFYNHRPSRYSTNYSPAKIVANFLSLKFDNDPGTLQALKHKIEDLNRLFVQIEKPFQSGLGIKSILKNEKKIASTRELLNEIIGAIDGAMTNYEKETKIPEEVRRNILDNIITEYNSKNYLYQLFKKLGKGENLALDEGESIGINQFAPRSSFLKNWHIPHFGMGSHYGDELAEQENRNALAILHSKVKDGKNFTIDENEMAEVIEKLKDKQMVIIGRNIFFDGILEHLPDYIPDWKQTSQHGFTGNFYNGKIGNLLIFNLYDSFFNDKSFLVIPKEQILGVVDQSSATDEFELIKNFKASFLDYATDQASFSAFLENPPQWLVEQQGETPEKLREFLSRQVWIRVFKKTYFALGAEKTLVNYLIK